MTSHPPSSSSYSQQFNPHHSFSTLPTLARSAPPIVLLLVNSSLPALPFTTPLSHFTPSLPLPSLPRATFSSLPCPLCPVLTTFPSVSPIILSLKTSGKHLLLQSYPGCLLHSAATGGLGGGGREQGGGDDEENRDGARRRHDADCDDA